MRKIFILFLSLSLILLTLGFFYFLNIIKYNNSVFDQNIDGIAILTGGKGRISLGLNLLALRPDNKLIISGVDKITSKRSILPISLQKDNRVYIDRDSKSTFDNAKIITKWAERNDLQNIHVITSYYHMPRSMLLLNQFSNNINYYAYPVKKESSKNLNFFDNLPFTFFLMEEYIKYFLSLIIITLY